MSDVVEMCSFVLRDIFLFCDRRTLIDILPTTRKIRDVISSEFSSTPYLMLRHISLINGTEWRVKSGNMTSCLLKLPTDIIATHKFIRSQQTDLCISFGNMSFDLLFQAFCHLWRDQKMVIAFCGLCEPVPLLPQDFINAIGTSRDLKLFTTNQIKLLPYLNNFLQTGQFNKIGIYDLNDNENIVLHADTVSDFLFKMPNCGDRNSNVLSTSNVLNIKSKDASAVRKPLEAIINQVKKRFLQSIKKHHFVFYWRALQSKFVHEEFDVVNKHTGQYLRLTVQTGYCFELTTIKDELNPDEETELQQILKF